MSPAPTKRKRPQCHTCGSPMAGHKRQNGFPICPKPPSPPPSPRITASQLEEIFIPESGLWHRRNPNWVDPPPPPPSTPYAGSLAPTELNDPNSDADSDISVAKTDIENDTDDDDKSSVSSRSSFSSSSGISFVDRVLASSEPLASLFATPTDAIPRVRSAADKHGLHVGLVRNPHCNAAWSPSESSSCKGRSVNVNADAETRANGPCKGPRGLASSTSWWVVMGKNAQAVKHLLDVHQRGMPGTLEPGCDVVMMAANKNSGGVPWFLQLALAGAIGGLVVVYGLSLL